MTYIESLMHELDLKPDLIKSALNKIENACKDYEINTGRHFAFLAGGNGDGDN